jgi:hypothetical protein
MTTPLDVFGPGICYVTRTDVTNATPINIGFAQGLSLDFAGTIKELYGQNQYPLDAARGTIKVTGKATAAVVSGIAWNNFFFGNAFVGGGFKWNVNEQSNLGATVVVANSATFDQDLGVVDAVSGVPFIKVASAPAAGQYSVNTATGTYSFNSSDVSAAKIGLFTYTSTVAGTIGQTLNVNNTLLGTSPAFQLDYYTSRANKPLVLRLFQCQASKLTFATKLEDFAMPEFDFSAFANSAGNIAKIVFPEIT